jgi:hypothetical protein
MKRLVPLVVVSLVSLGCPGEVPPTPLPARSPAPAAAPTPTTPTTPTTTASTATNPAAQPLVKYYALPG